MATFQVGYDPSLYFPNEGTPATQEAIDKAVSTYIAFLRTSRHPPNFFAQATSSYKSRFDEMKKRLKGDLTEISPELVALRREVANEVGVNKLQWPDFTWKWDSSAELMALLLGLCCGDVGRQDLPSHLPFPPPTLQTLTFARFNEWVQPYVRNVAVPDVNASQLETLLYRNIVRGFFMTVILETMTYGLRFDLSRNFRYNPAEEQYSVKYTLPQVFREFPTGLWVNTRVGKGTRRPPPCVDSKQKVVNPLHTVRLHCFERDPSLPADVGNDLLQDLSLKIQTLIRILQHLDPDIVMKQAKQEDKFETILFLTGAKTEPKSTLADITALRDRFKGIIDEIRAEYAVPDEPQFTEGLYIFSPDIGARI